MAKPNPKILVLGSIHLKRKCKMNIMRACVCPLWQLWFKIECTYTEWFRLLIRLSEQVHGGWGCVVQDWVHWGGQAPTHDHCASKLPQSSYARYLHCPLRHMQLWRISTNNPLAHRHECILFEPSSSSSLVSPPKWLRGPSDGERREREGVMKRNEKGGGGRRVKLKLKKKIGEEKNRVWYRYRIATHPSWMGAPTTQGGYAEVCYKYHFIIYYS